MSRYAALLSFVLAAGCSVREGVIGRAGSAAAPREYTVRHGLVYARPDGEALTLDAYIPEGPGPFPGLLVIHGGGWAARRPGDMVHIARALARRGYVALNVIYRLAPKHRYPAAVDDVREAARWARAEAPALKLDPKRLGAWGYSAGAHLAAMLGVAPGPVPAAGAVVAGGLPADFSRWPHSPIITPFIGKTYAEAPEVWKEASPVAHAAAGAPPFFLYHGLADRLVEPEQAALMAAALRRAGGRAEFYGLRGLDHTTAFVFDSGAVAAAIDFLDAAL